MSQPHLGDWIKIALTNGRSRALVLWEQPDGRWCAALRFRDLVQRIEAVADDPTSALAALELAVQEDVAKEMRTLGAA